MSPDISTGIVFLFFWNTTGINLEVLSEIYFLSDSFWNFSTNPFKNILRDCFNVPRISSSKNLHRDFYKAKLIGWNGFFFFNLEKLIQLISGILSYIPPGYCWNFHQTIFLPFIKNCSSEKLLCNLWCLGY